MAKKSNPTPVEEIKEQLSKKRAIEAPDFANGLSTGSTLLNLAYTGRPHVGYVPGNYFFLVGNSNSGKTWISLVAMAEAALNPKYKDYRFILDNVEEGIQMSLAKFFGKSMAERLEPPSIIDGQPRHSERIEDFYFNLDDALSKGPCIYVLDSMDGLSSSGEHKYFKKLKSAARKQGDEKEDKKAPGSFGDGKAKVNSSMIRQMIPKISRTGSILIIISQTRDVIERFSYEDETHSGGHSLDFYAQVQTWTKIREKITKEVRKTDRHIGNKCLFRVKRSRFTGRESRVEIPIYFSHGVDDVGSCVEWLIKENHWKKAGSSLTASEFDFKGFQEKLIEKIESENLECKLQQIVADVWYDIEEAMSVNRKRKYT